MTLPVRPPCSAAARRRSSRPTGPLVALGEQEPGEGEVLVLAQVGQLVVGVELLLDRPRGGVVQLAAAEPQPGPHRGHRPHVRGVVAVVDPLGLVEQGERGVEIALGLAQPGHHDPPPVRVLRQAVVLAEALGWPRGARRRPRGRRARAAPRPVRRACRPCRAAAVPAGARSRARFERAPGRRRAGPGSRRMSPRVMRAAEDVGEEPGVPQPRDGLGVRGVRAARGRPPPTTRARPGPRRRRGPGRRPAGPGPAPPARARRCRRGRRRAAPARPGTSRWPRGATGSPPRRRRPARAAVAAGQAPPSRAQQRLDVVEPPTDGGEVRHLRERADERHGEHRAGPHHVVGQRAHPAGELGLPPLPRQRGHGELHQVRGAARRPRRPGRARSPRRCSPSASYQALARRCSSATSVGLLVEQVRAQDVGEQVVVAVPAGAGRRAGRGTGWPVEGDEQRRAAALPGDGVAQRAGQPRRGRTSASRKSRTSAGCRASTSSAR